MLWPIDLDDQRKRCTVVVREKGSHRVLSPQGRAEAGVAQIRPQLLLGPGNLAPKFARPPRLLARPERSFPHPGPPNLAASIASLPRAGEVQRPLAMKR